MVDNGNRRSLSSFRLGLLGMLMPLTLASAAQTPIHEVSRSQPVALATPASTLPAAMQASAVIQAEAASATGFDVSAFEAIAEQLTVGQRIPGLSMAIVQNGRVLSARGYGVTDVSSPQAVDGHTVFRLASLSKAFAGTMAGLLVADGSLRWDSKVSEYVPGFQLSDSFATQRVTVADLLSHRVGLKSHNAFDRDIEGNAEYYAVSRKLASAPMSCTPGECYAYQNVAFSLIGDVVFAATGRFYDQAVDRRIFKPLGMNDASIGLAGIEGSARWARPHVRSRNGWVSLNPKPTYYRLPPAAGVNASASDMAQWLLAQTGHRPDVLPAPLLATLHAPIIATPGEARRGGWRRQRVSAASYALGWRVLEYAGQPVVFHAGAVQGYRGLLALVPGRDFGVAIMWNSESGLPSGLLPTVLDHAMGLPAQQWLDDEIGSELLLADSYPAAVPSESGPSSGKANASPR